MKVLPNRITLENIGDITSDISTLSDLLSIICGMFIGRGMYRDVYEYSLNKNYVVKIIRAGQDPSSNINEYQIYQEVEGLMGPLEWVKDWFAPVVWMSQGGKVLLQKRTKPFHNKLTPPKKVPSFLFDVKSDNFGWIGNKFVCHDYGMIWGFINYKNKFKTINWG